MSKYEDYVNNKIVPRIRCRRCHHPVLESGSENYPFQCVVCDEDLYGIETVWSDEPVSEHEFDYLAECVRNEGLAD